MIKSKNPGKQIASKVDYATAEQMANELAGRKRKVPAKVTAVFIALLMLICITSTSAYLFDAKALSTTFTMHAEMPAFAIYSADDRSLDLYKRTDVPSVGDIFEGKTVTAVYTGIEALTARPWSSQVSNVQTVKVVDEGIAPISCKNWFYQFANCKTMDLTKLDMSRATNTSGMFQACTSLTKIYASDKWNISNVTASQNMFLGCKNLIGGNGTAYNASYIGKEYARIDTAATPGYLTYIAPKQAFAIYSADDQSLCFYNRYGMPSAGEAFEGRTATAIYTGFEGNASYPWDANRERIKSVKVVDEGIMPASCSNWFAQFTVCETMDLSKLDTSNTTNMANMFFYTRRLGSLDLSGWNTSNVRNMSAMFDRSTVPSDGLIGISDLDTSNVGNMSYMFRENPSLTTLSLDNWNTSNVTNMYCMFSNCTALVSLGLSYWNTSSLMDMSRMFYNCRSLKALDLASFDTSKVTDLTYTFYLCSGLTSLDVSNFDTSGVRYMTGTFYGCWSLAFLDISTWDTSAAVRMNQMFFQCNALPSLNLSSFDMSNVETVSDMFYNCRMLTTLDLSTWSTTNITTFDTMFDNCVNLEVIYVSDKWSTSSVVSGFDMFKDCISLIGGNGTVYDASYTDELYARIDTEVTPGYLTDALQSDLSGAEDPDHLEAADQTIGIENEADAGQVAANGPIDAALEAIDPESNDGIEAEIPNCGIADIENDSSAAMNKASDERADEGMDNTLGSDQGETPHGQESNSGIGKSDDADREPYAASIQKEGLYKPCVEMGSNAIPRNEME